MSDTLQFVVTRPQIQLTSQLAESVRHDKLKCVEHQNAAESCWLSTAFCYASGLVNYLRGSRVLSIQRITQTIEV